MPTARRKTSSARETGSARKTSGAKKRTSAKRARTAQTLTLAGWVEARFLKRRGLWQVRLRYRSPGLSTQTEAEAWVEAEGKEEAVARGGDELTEARLKLTRRLQRRDLPRGQRGSLPLGAFYEEVWRERVYKQLPANSQDGHDQVWSKWIEPYISGYTLHQFGEDGPTLGHLWVLEMQHDGAGVPTIRKAVYHVRGYLTWALKWRYLTNATENPLRYVELPKAEFVVPSEYALQLEQVEALAWLTGGSIRNTLWAELIGCEALRQQELCCLRWIDLYHPDWQPRDYAEVTQAISGRGKRRQIKELKNRAEGRRNPELWRPLLPVLEAVRAEEQVSDLNARIFVAESWDGLPDAKNWGSDIFPPALEASGIEQDGIYGHLTPHRLRAAAGTAFGYALRPMHEVMGFMGHTQITTSLDWYLRAYKNPLPELRGMPFPDQISRARGLVLPQVQARVAKLAAAAEEHTALAREASTRGRAKEARKQGALRANRQRELGYARRKAELLGSLVGGS